MGDFYVGQKVWYTDEKGGVPWYRRPVRAKVVFVQSRSGATAVQIKVKKSDRVPQDSDGLWWLVGDLYEATPRP